MSIMLKRSNAAVPADTTQLDSIAPIDYGCLDSLLCTLPFLAKKGEFCG